MKTGATLDILKRARALIDTPEKWTKNAYARDRFGAKTAAVIGGNAVAFCSVGALLAVSDTTCATRSGTRLALSALNRWIPPDDEGLSIGVSMFNDASTHKEVMEVWDKAIAAEEAATK